MHLYQKKIERNHKLVGSILDGNLGSGGVDEMFDLYVTKDKWI